MLLPSSRSGGSGHGVVALVLAAGATTYVVLCVQMHGRAPHGRIAFGLGRSPGACCWRRQEAGTFKLLQQLTEDCGQALPWTLPEEERCGRRMAAGG